MGAPVPHTRGHRPHGPSPCPARGATAPLPQAGCCGPAPVVRLPWSGSRGNGTLCPDSAWHGASSALPPNERTVSAGPAEPSSCSAPGSGSQRGVRPISRPRGPRTRTRTGPATPVLGGEAGAPAPPLTRPLGRLLLANGHCPRGQPTPAVTLPPRRLALSPGSTRGPSGEPSDPDPRPVAGVPWREDGTSLRLWFAGGRCHSEASGCPTRALSAPCRCHEAHTWQLLTVCSVEAAQPGCGWVGRRGAGGGHAKGRADRGPLAMVPPKEHVCHALAPCHLAVPPRLGLPLRFPPPAPLRRRCTERPLHPPSRAPHRACWTRPATEARPASLGPREVRPLRQAVWRPSL